MTIAERLASTQVFKSGRWFSPTEMTVILDCQRESLDAALIELRMRGVLEKHGYRYRKNQIHPGHAIFDKRVRKRTLPIPKVFGERGWVAS